MTRFVLSLMLPLVALGACSSATPLSTASLTGGSPAAAAGAPAEPPQARNDPTSRALQVGTTSARALKCGYNFDPAKLKSAYLAYETSLGATPADLAKIEQVYNVGFNGVAKALVESSDYCTEAKTREIKADLTRHLAGDYSPPPPKVVAKKDEGGFLSTIFDGDNVESGPKFGSSDWWDKQRERIGK